jgi:hypothetical protein
MKHLRLFEEHINEIGDASAKPFKVKGPSPKQVLKDMIKAQGDRTHDDGWYVDDEKHIWSFDGEKGTSYTIEIAWNTKKKMGKPKRFIKNPATYRKYEMRMNIGFYVKSEPSTGTEFNIDDEDDKERTTNLGEQYRILATVIDTAIPVINEVAKDFAIETIYIIPKADKGEEESIHNKRGRFYLAYLKKAIKKINDKVTVTADRYIGGYLIRGGHISGSGGGDIGYIRNESTVNEIGDRSVEPGDWIQSKYEKDHKGYSFMTKDEERYYAYFEKKPKVWLNNQGMMKVEEIKNGAKVWETSFGHLKGHIHGYGGEVDFKSVTNKGSHFEILSTYSEILEDFLKNNKGKADIIIAKPEKGSEGDSRRLRLYQAFLQKTKIFKKVETIKVFGREVILLHI